MSKYLDNSDEPSDLINLNISGGSRYRCQVSYIPESVLEHGGKGDYLCRIPFALGVRAFRSLDLIHEFPLAGLPQFCHAIYRTGEPLLIQDNGFPVATTIDVQRASIARYNGGRSALTLELNKYASDLVKEVASRPNHLSTLLCFEQIVGPEKACLPKANHDHSSGAAGNNNPLAFSGGKGGQIAFDGFGLL
jgi:hypothetical protein